MPESHPRGRCPCWNPEAEPGGRTRRLMPVVDPRGLHPATSRDIPRHDPGQRPLDHATGFITPSDPLETVDVPSSGIHPGPAEPSTRGSTRGMDQGLTRLRRELQMCRLPSVSLRAGSGGAALRSAPPPARFAASGSDLRVLRGALRRCARYGLRVAATLSARAPTRATRRFAPRHAPSPSARFPSRREAAFGSLLFRFMEVVRQAVPRVHARGSGGVWPAVSPTPRGSDPSALRFATHLLRRFR